MENRTPLTFMKFSRGYLTGESKNSVIITFENGTKIWLPKSMLKSSEFTLIASLGIAKDYTYNLVDKPDQTISSDELIALLKPIELA